MKTWINMNEHDELKHRNALDLNLRPVPNAKLHYRLPNWMQSDEVVNLTDCGSSQVRILLAITHQLSMKIK